ncbi:hypothetical protein Y603_4983 [Burkholderia pseudomallei MSHR1153]|nr:hypothetical protein Y603_4983 [Burkholderia pseudomallei MSHR1153]
MCKLIARFVAAVLLFFLNASVVSAQIGPAEPPVLYVHPIFGPICAGPLGPGPCQDVRRFIQIQWVAAQLNLPVINIDPMLGPICASPLGPGPCAQLKMFFAMRQVAEQEFQLRQISNAPGSGATCIGPLGPAPCDAVRGYMMGATVGVDPSQAPNARQVNVVSNLGGTGVGALCDGPIGKIPCTLVGQISLDRIGGSTPSQSSFGLPPGIANVQQLAAECAKRVGVDVGAFAGCTGQQVVLPKNQQDVLNCAIQNTTAAGFGACAAPKLGLALSNDQLQLVRCAMTGDGSENAFKSCIGGTLANRMINGDARALLDCAQSANGQSVTFASCASRRLLSESQRAILDCAVSAQDATSFSLCASPNVGVKLSDDQRVVAQCAMRTKGDPDAFAQCAGSAFLGKNLGPKEQAVLGCAASASGDMTKFASCSAGPLLGNNLSREQQVAIQCAAESHGDAGGWAACAGANMFNLQLNPEQQIAVQCVVQTGGQPYAAAGCMASRLTMRELSKCLTDGVGGDGCFGDSNDLVGRNGWVARTMGQITGGPNSVISNPNQIWGGDNSFVRNPGQIFGGDNSFVRNPGQIFGGSNSVFHNPGQLLPQPRPMQIGSVGGKRICLPWC